MYFLENNEEYIDYGAIYNQKYPLLRKAYENFKSSDNHEMRENLEDFKRENASWLNDYSLYISLKNHFNGLPWNEWAHDIKIGNMEQWNITKNELADDIEYHNFIQFLFFKQWGRCKKIRK